MIMAIKIFQLTGYIKNDDERPNTEVIAEEDNIPCLESIRSLLESNTDQDIEALEKEGIAIANYRNLRIAEVKYLDEYEKK